MQDYMVVPDHMMKHTTVERFLGEIAGERPVRFTPEQLSGFTHNYSARLGTGGFGAVYKGMLPNGLLVAVKRLHATHDEKTSQGQFMADVGTIGRTHHINLVRLLGFCFGDAVLALVYEYMDNGALDAYLFDQGHVVSLPKRDIAVSVARGLRYLHECQQKIIHYDIKAGNVFLDGSFTPKVADFGLARSVNRVDTHVAVSCVRGTPGYAAPEMWMQSGVTEKCDVYSFGMLLLEIIGQRRNFDQTAPESLQWFPKLAWTKYETGEVMELMVPPVRSEELHGVSVQQPSARPQMSAVVKMLEGEMNIAAPANPFQHLIASATVADLSTTMESVNTVPMPMNETTTSYPRCKSF
ncbi:hypothetical protein BRADI_1g58166v3 [Brachypodium distachyon]|uniref:non-specific serine/threonine protein kinase n=1 Tax=Brachypodium distachyon TaxID=15368 RepID=A0A0Q3NU44_BRADI|nr:hypothetical protein BRADI_1g58166v3 [Brachypodium distachyon]